MKRELENGFTKFPNKLLEVMVGAEFNGTQKRIILFIIRQTKGFHEYDNWISVDMLVKATGLSRTTIKNNIRDLVKSNVIEVTKNYTRKTSKKMRVNEDHTTWKNINVPSEESLSISKKYGLKNKLIGEINTKNKDIDRDNNINSNLSEGKKIDPPESKQIDPHKGKQNDPQEGKETFPNKERERNNKKEKKVNELFENVWNMLPRKDKKSRVKYSQRKKLYYKYGSEILIEAAKEFCEEMKKYKEEDSKKYITQASNFFNKKAVEYADRIVKEQNDMIPFSGKFQS